MILLSNIFALAAFFASVWLPGWYLGQYMTIKSVYMRAVVAYGLGTALISGELFIYFFILKLHFSVWLFVAIFLQALLCSVLIFLNKKKMQPVETLVLKKWKPIELLVVSLIGICITFATLQAAVKPPIAFDALANWSKKSKILLRDGKINFDKNSDIYLAVPGNASYPWHSSLLEYWLRQLGGGDITVNIIPLSYFIGIILSLYYFLSQRLNKFNSLVLVLFFSSMPLILYHSFNLYADLVLAFYVMMAVILFIQWLETRNNNFLYYSAVFVGWGYFVKNDGLFPIIAWLLALGVTWLMERKNISWKSICISLGFLIGPIIFWLGFKQSLKLSNSFANYQFHPEVMTSAINALFVHNSWNVWWWLFILVIILKIKQIVTSSQYWSIWVFFITMCILINSVFFFTDYYQYALNYTAIERTLIPLIPVSIILAGLALQEKNKDINHTL